MSNRLSRVARRILVAALLPLMAFRALIPGGLMPAIGADGALRLQLCPGTNAAVPNHVQHSGSAGRDNSTHHDHDGTGGPAGLHQTVCPFESLSTPACASTMFRFATVTLRQALVASRNVAQITFPTIIRTQSPRAPPRYS
jgi:hypothetical protein